MSDGPHRSLNMRRGWKLLAERADKSAYSSEEICAALPMALDQDWRLEVPEGLCKQIREAVNPEQGTFFADSQQAGIEALRRRYGVSPLAVLFLDYVTVSMTNGLVGEKALVEAVCNALSEYAVRGARNVEEHYRRKSTENRAVNVRDRLEKGIGASDMNALARHLLGFDGGDHSSTVSKKSGLDDGVQLR